MKLLILLICFFSVTFLVNCDTLKSLFIVHRHGDRAPFKTNIYPNDPFKNESYWPRGFEQLTENGEKRMFNIGALLRKKYVNFLSDKIREVRALSSDKERCIESAQISVSGMYRTKKNNCKKSQPLQLVPIHTRPYNSDSLLNPSSICPASDEEKSKVYDEMEVTKADKENSVLYKYLTEKSGKQIKSYNDVLELQDVFDCQIFNGLKLPDWVTPDILQKTSDIRANDFILRSSTKKLQRFKTGVFLNDFKTKTEKLIKSINLTAEDGYELGKVNIYSTHDFFISALLSALNIFNGRIPPYGVTIVFELHQKNSSHLNWDESSFIKILFLNETSVYPSTDNFYLLNACNNTDFCSVKNFFASVSDLILTPDEWIKECHAIVPIKRDLLLQEAYTVKKVDLIKDSCLIIISIIAIVLIVLIFIVIFKEKVRQPYRQRLVG